MERPSYVPDILSYDYTRISAQEFARALFDRPVPDPGPDPDWQGEIFDPNPGDQRFVELCTELFTRFGELSAPYSVGQIDQGLWKLHGAPYFLNIFHLTEPELPGATAIECVESAVHLYTDFLCARIPDTNVGSLYMWWDCRWRGATPAFLSAVLAALKTILHLPNDQCRLAAQHGLGHFIGDQPLPPGVVKAIDAFLAAEEGTLSAEVLEYTSRARTGQIL
ncbi:MAG: hypothetical protein AB7N24_21620 [Dehalococcoidia bacterium]